MCVVLSECITEWVGWGQRGRGDGSADELGSYGTCLVQGMHNERADPKHMHCHSLCLPVCPSVFLSVYASLPPFVTEFIHYSNGFACIVIVSILHDKWRQLQESQRVQSCGKTPFPPFRIRFKRISLYTILYYIHGMSLMSYRQPVRRVGLKGSSVPQHAGLVRHPCPESACPVIAF